MQEFNVGDRAFLPTTFVDEDGVVTDPTTIIFRVASPSKRTDYKTYGITTADASFSWSDVVRDSTGVYHVEVDCDEAGIWSWRCEGTGAIVAANQDQFRVMPTFVPA